MYLIPGKPNSTPFFIFLFGLSFLRINSPLMVVNIILLIGKAARLRRVHTW